MTWNAHQGGGLIFVQVASCIWGGFTIYYTIRKIQEAEHDAFCDEQLLSGRVYGLLLLRAFWSCMLCGGAGGLSPAAQFFTERQRVHDAPSVFYWQERMVCMNIYRSASQLVGHTPLLQPVRYLERLRLPATVLVKLEYLNPAGSVKDRVALEMIEDAEMDGRLAPGGVIVEPTSGNTGIGLAAMGLARGYKVILTMPESMSVERRQLLAAYGAELVLTPAKDGMGGAVEKAKEIAAGTPNSFLAGQFDNPANPRAHYRTTGPEIWHDTDGQVDIFVAGVGTGGTVTGVGRYLKEKKPGVQIVAVEPAASPLLSGGKAGGHGLQGIGANFVPENFDRSVVDEVLPVWEKDAYAAARLLAGTEGVLVGISAGAALHAAGELARRPENAGKTIVALLPDTGDRYLSTPLFQE